jgi:hypothetical protein
MRGASAAGDLSSDPRLHGLIALRSWRQRKSDKSGVSIGKAVRPWQRRRERHSGLEHTSVRFSSLRPVVFQNRDEIDYGATQKAEPFKNPFATVSRKSVANLVAKLATTPGLEIRSSLGVHRAY